MTEHRHLNEKIYNAITNRFDQLRTKQQNRLNNDESSEESTNSGGESMLIAASSSNAHEAMREYARKKRKGTKWEPYYFGKHQVPENPPPDYNIQFTRIENTADNISTPLSSLGLDDVDVSSIDLTTTGSTESTPRSSPTTRKSRRTRRALTPSDLLRKNSFAISNRMNESKSRNGRQSIDSPRNFEKNLKVSSNSTPLMEIHQRKSGVASNSAAERINDVDVELVSSTEEGMGNMHENAAPATKIASIMEETLVNNGNHEPDSTQKSPTNSQQTDVVIIESDESENNTTNDDINERTLTNQQQSPATIQDSAERPVAAATITNINQDLHENIIVLATTKPNSYPTQSVNKQQATSLMPNITPNLTESLPQQPFQKSNVVNSTPIHQQNATENRKPDQTESQQKTTVVGSPGRNLENISLVTDDSSDDDNSQEGSPISNVNTGVPKIIIHSASDSQNDDSSNIARHPSVENSKPQNRRTTVGSVTTSHRSGLLCPNVLDMSKKSTRNTTNDTVIENNIPSIASMASTHQNVENMTNAAVESDQVEIIDRNEDNGDDDRIIDEEPIQANLQSLINQANSSAAINTEIVYTEGPPSPLLQQQQQQHNNKDSVNSSVQQLPQIDTESIEQHDSMTVQIDLNTAKWKPKITLARCKPPRQSRKTKSIEASRIRTSESFNQVLPPLQFQDPNAQIIEERSESDGQREWKETRKQRKRKTDEKSAEEPIVNIEKRSSNGRKSRKLYSGDSQSNITEEPSTSSSTNHSTAKPQNHEENDQTPTLEHTNNDEITTAPQTVTINDGGDGEIVAGDDVANLSDMNMEIEVDLPFAMTQDQEPSISKSTKKTTNKSKSNKKNNPVVVVQSIDNNIDANSTSVSTARPDDINDAGNDEEVIPSNSNIEIEGDETQNSTSQQATTSKSTKKSTAESKSSRKRDPVVLPEAELIENDMDENNATEPRRSTRVRNIPAMVTHRQTLMRKVFCDSKNSKITKKKAKSKVPKEPSTKADKKRNRLNDKKSETVAKPKNQKNDEPPKKKGRTKPSSSAPMEDSFNFSDISVDKTKWLSNLKNMDKKQFQPKKDGEYDICSVETSKGKIEITHFDLMYFVEDKGVDYGFEPSNKNRNCGYMRFRPRALKASAVNDRLVEFQVFVGQFKIKIKNNSHILHAADFIEIQKDAEYSILNMTDSEGIIQFRYRSS